MRSPWLIYRMVSYSVTLNDSEPRFHGLTIIRHWISQNRYEINTWLLLTIQTTNRTWCVAQWIVLLSTTLTAASRSLMLFLPENNCSLLFRSLLQSPGDDAEELCRSIQTRQTVKPTLLIKRSDGMSREQLFISSHLTSRTVIWCWARPVSIAKFLVESD